MADMFYFRSPAKTPSPKCRLDLRHKLKVCKRRRCTKMDDQLQRACVARLNEPIFCASSLASLIPQHDFSDYVASRQDNRISSIHATQRAEDGTFLTSRGITGAHDHTSQDPQTTSQPGDTSLDSPHLTQDSGLGVPDAGGDDVQTTTSPHDGSHESITLVHRLLHLIDSNMDRWPRNNSDESAAPPIDSILPQPMYISSGLRGLANYVYETDDDALAVDDPRRSYDFKEFMQRWHKDEFGSEQHLSMEQTLFSLLPVPHAYLNNRDIERGKMDVQGLRWNSTTLKRDQTIRSRQFHHPSNHSVISCSGSSNVHSNENTELSHLPETQYRFRFFSQRHRARYSHYQLRNVLAATDRNHIFYATGGRVIETALASPSRERTVMNLSKGSPSHASVQITCISATRKRRFDSYRSDRVLLAGGFGGEYAMLDTAAEGTTSMHTGFLTHDYNGLVTHVDSYPDRRSGVLKGCFCSNDRKVRIMDIKTQRFTSTFEFENAANCTAMSADGRLRVLVGDSNETLITDADKGDILVTMKEHQDHGFACAWSEDGRHVATGAQDGVVVSWDSRNWSRPLRTMPCGMATARSLHFTFDNALVVGEDDDLITIYDTRLDSVKQEIRFFGSVAGVALLDGGEEMVAANADATVGGLLSFQRKPQSHWWRDEYSGSLVNDFMSQQSESGYGVVV